MAATIPEARLLAILRDPVDRAYSHYWMEHVRGRDVDAGRSRTPRRDYLERGRYLPQLQAACERFGRERLAVVLLDDLRSAPEATYAEVCGFLGVDGGFRPPRLGERVNRFVAFRSMRVRNARRRLPKKFRIGRIVGKLNAVEGDYPPLDPALAARLRADLAADNAALAAWLGRDLSSWGA